MKVSLSPRDITLAVFRSGGLPVMMTDEYTAQKRVRMRMQITFSFLVVI